MTFAWRIQIDTETNMTRRKHIALWASLMVFLLLLLTVGWGSMYLLNYSLSPESQRTSIDSCLQRQFTDFPEVQEWYDSLRQTHALCDTFLIMPDGERHHALYIRQNKNEEIGKGKHVRKMAFIIHGWRDCGIDFLHLARIYERDLNFSVLLPDLHAHGLSDGDAICMGWREKDDMKCWLKTFTADTVVIHGVSMGAATAMMMSADSMPKGVAEVRFIEDCGYTDVWEEFAWQLKEQFSLMPFPLMYTASLLCKWRYGWHFREASAIEQVKKSPYPMLFIHGDSDTFVPTAMVYRLYDAKQGKKQLWITKDTEHAQSYRNYPEAYTSHIRNFVMGNIAK